jgi:hypothetical protein
VVTANDGVRTRSGGVGTGPLLWKAVRVDQRLSLVTLGVADTGRARAFYGALGWSGESPDGDVVFFQAGGMIVALWGRDKLSGDSTVVDTGGWGGVTLAYNAGSPAEVDAILARPNRRGPRLVERAHRRSGVAIPASSSTSMAILGRSLTTPAGVSPATFRYTSTSPSGLHQGLLDRRTETGRGHPFPVGGAPGIAGVRPWRAMTPKRASRSGGPPGELARTSAISWK